MKKDDIQKVLIEKQKKIVIATHLLTPDDQFRPNFSHDTNLFRSPKSQNDHNAGETNEFLPVFHSFFTFIQT